MKTKKSFLIIILTIVTVLLLASCGEDEPAVRYNVSFYSDGSFLGSVMVTEGYVVSPIASPTKDHYDFDGWYNGTAKYNLASKVYSDLTLTAGWKEKIYSVKYVNVLAGAGAVPEDDNEYSISNTAATVLAGPTAPSEGNTFMGWNTKVDGTGTSYTAGNSLTVNSDVTLYAIWDGVTAKACSIWSAYSNKTISSNIVLNPKWFFSSNTANQSFNKGISNFASIIAVDISGEGYCNLTSGTKDKTENKGLYTSLGFSDVTEIKETDYTGLTKDKDDIVNFVMCHQEYTIDSKTVSLVIVNIDGTGSSPSQWASNLDLGASSESYYGYISGATDWTYNLKHKGFDVAAGRVEAKVNEYISGKTSITSCETVAVLFTGHSRGAAVANIVGDYYQNSPTISGTTITPFTYTFATPNTYMQGAHPVAANTIFNIVNTNDIVPYVPALADVTQPKAVAEAFGKYGKTINVDTSGLEGYIENDVAEIIGYFKAVCKTRDDIYKLQDLGDGIKIPSNVKTYLESIIALELRPYYYEIDESGYMKKVMPAMVCSLLQKFLSAGDLEISNEETDELIDLAITLCMSNLSIFTNSTYDFGYYNDLVTLIKNSEYAAEITDLLSNDYIALILELLGDDNITGLLSFAENSGIGSTIESEATNMANGIIYAHDPLTYVFVSELAEVN